MTRQQDEKLDTTVADSMPASDPPSHTPTAGTRRAEQSPPRYGAHETGKPEDGDHRSPTAMPTDDRHAAETTAARIEGEQIPERKTS